MRCLKPITGLDDSVSEDELRLAVMEAADEMFTYKKNVLTVTCKPRARSVLSLFKSEEIKKI